MFEKIKEIICNQESLENFDIANFDNGKVDYIVELLSPCLELFSTIKKNFSVQDLESIGFRSCINLQSISYDFKNDNINAIVRMDEDSIIMHLISNNNVKMEYEVYYRVSSSSHYLIARKYSEKSSFVLTKLDLNYNIDLKKECFFEKNNSSKIDENLNNIKLLCEPLNSIVINNVKKSITTLFNGEDINFQRQKK